MPNYKVRVSQKVYYDIEFWAASPALAVRAVARGLYDGGADEPDMMEVDSEDFIIEPIQTDANGDEYQGQDVAEALHLAAQQKWE